MDDIESQRRIQTWNMSRVFTERILQLERDARALRSDLETAQLVVTDEADEMQRLRRLLRVALLLSGTALLLSLTHL